MIKYKKFDFFSNLNQYIKLIKNDDDEAPIKYSI